MHGEHSVNSVVTIITSEITKLQSKDERLCNKKAFTFESEGWDSYCWRGKVSFPRKSHSMGCCWLAATFLGMPSDLALPSSLWSPMLMMPPGAITQNSFSVERALCVWHFMCWLYSALKKDVKVSKLLIFFRSDLLMAKVISVWSINWVLRMKMNNLTVLKLHCQSYRALSTLASVAQAVRRMVDLFFL